MNDDRKIFRYVVRDGKSCQGAACHQKLFADLDDLDQFRRVRIEIDHVAGFLRCLAPRIHSHAYVSLRERRGVIAEN